MIFMLIFAITDINFIHTGWPGHQSGLLWGEMSCCSALCFNNHRTSDALGNELKFYRLPRSTELQREYLRILQTTGINWNSAVLTSVRSTGGKGFREHFEDLPDVPAHESQIARLRIKLEKARRRNNTSLAKALSRKIDLATRL